MAEYYQQNAKPKKSHTLLWVLLIFAVVMIAIILWAVSVGSTASEEYPVMYEEPYIGVLHVEDTITAAGSAMAYDNNYDHEYLLSSIDTMIGDEYNRGMLLYIDSPGGEVMAGVELADKLVEYKELTGRPIYAYGHNYAASGGYWVAAAADQIYLNRYCTTGSIGVRFNTMVDFSGLLEKYGVEARTIASGAQKSGTDSFAGINEETYQIYQAVVDEYYGYFLDWICDQRGLDRDYLIKLADGRIYTATQAVANDLADEVGTYEDCLAALEGEISEGVSIQTFRPADMNDLYSLLYSISAANNEITALLQQLPPTGVLAYYQQ